MRGWRDGRGHDFVSSARSAEYPERSRGLDNDRVLAVDQLAARGVKQPPRRCRRRGRGLPLWDKLGDQTSQRAATPLVAKRRRARTSAPSKGMVSSQDSFCGPRRP
jgi:hypothetical protein